MDLKTFQQKVSFYRAQAGITQKNMARQMGLHPTVLSNKLNSSAQAFLTHAEIKKIVLLLAEWEAITAQAEAVELLELMNLRRASFTLAEWNSSPLCNLDPSPKEDSSAKLANSVQQKPGLSKKPQPLAEHHNLPIQLTSFIGRQREIAELQQLTQANRLVTIAGVGGAGKTRLALEVAARSLERFKDGILFVELASLTDPNLLVQALLTTLGLSYQNGSRLDIVTDYLQSKQFLLVLDNCEHLINACAQVAHALLLACPELHILATSREMLNIGSEIIWRIPSLSLPPAPTSSKALHEVETFARAEAVQLFVERAKNVQLNFELEPHNIEALSRICLRLDGIPLAIELAAGALKALSLEQVAVRLDENFRLLTGGSRVALPRQQTLEATIDWSYKLLEEPERVLLRRLSIFAGGFSLEDAEIVCSDPPLSQFEILNSLTQLIYKSMVVLENGRYRMLEMLRQYGQARLLELSELEPLQKHYIHWLLQLAQEASSKLNGPEQKFWMNRLIAEYPNLRAVLSLCFGSQNQADREIGVEICVLLANFWRGKTFGEESREWLEKAISMTEITRYRASLLPELGYLAVFSGEPAKALELHRESIALWRELEDKTGLASALGSFGNTLALQRESEEAEAVLKEALELYEQLNDKTGIATVLCSLGMNYHGYDRVKFDPAQAPSDKLFNLGVSYRVTENQDKARKVLEEALLISRESSDQTNVSFALQILGEVARAQGDYNRARVCYEEGLIYRRESGDYLRICASLLNLGFVANFFQDYEQAQAYFNEGLNLCKGHHLYRSVTAYFFGVAEVARSGGYSERAVKLLAATQVAHQSQGSTPDLSDMIEYDRTLERVRSELDTEELARIWEEGRMLSVSQAIDYALETLELPPVKTPRPQPKVKAPVALPDGLSPREVEVLRLVAVGLTNAEIAEKLVVSPRTVDAHLSAVYSKIGVKSRSSATRYAIEHKLVE